MKVAGMVRNRKEGKAGGDYICRCIFTECMANSEQTDQLYFYGMHGKSCVSKPSKHMSSECMEIAV